MIESGSRIAGTRTSWAAEARAARRPELDSPQEAPERVEPVSPPEPAEPAHPTASHEEASLAAKRINEILSSSKVELRIEMKGHHFAYVLVQRETGEVVREIPPEGIERFMERYDATARNSGIGVLVDRSV